MKAVVIKEPGNISLEQVNIPEPQAGFVRVKVKAAAICATDLEVLVSQGDSLERNRRNRSSRSNQFSVNR